MKSIDDIIRDECLSMQDCMLTVQDMRGEAGFFYFKEGELIEANYGTLWGKEALAEVLTWPLTTYALSPLPLGIKRSLWESLEALLNPKLQPTASGRIPTLKARYSDIGQKSESEIELIDSFRKINGVTQLIFLEQGKHRVLFQSETDSREPTEWFLDFVQKAEAIGKTLGFGTVEKWTLHTDRYYMIGLKYEKGILGVFRKHEAGLGDFETACLSSIVVKK